MLTSKLLQNRPQNAPTATKNTSRNSWQNRYLYLSVLGTKWIPEWSPNERWVVLGSGPGAAWRHDGSKVVPRAPPEAQKTRKRKGFNRKYLKHTKTYEVLVPPSEPLPTKRKKQSFNRKYLKHTKTYEVLAPPSEPLPTKRKKNKS